MINAQPTLPSAAASTHGAASPTLELLEARRLRDVLRSLLRAEQSAMADFLIALADFDRRGGWEPLGHANLFALLHVELRLSRSAAFYRKSAAELLQRFPEVTAPLREGRLCLSTVAELTKVLTEENREAVMPRFFGLSSREAQELVAELQPRPVPSTRMVVTGPQNRSVSSMVSTALPLVSLAAAPPADSHPNVVPLSRVLTSELANGGGAEAGFGCCGSTHRLELDHIIPWAEWGPSTVENLRIVCSRHNALAARRHFGARCAERYGGQGRRPSG